MSLATEPNHKILITIIVRVQKDLRASKNTIFEKAI